MTYHCTECGEILYKAERSNITLSYPSGFHHKDCSKSQVAKIEQKVKEVEKKVESERKSKSELSPEPQPDVSDIEDKRPKESLMEIEKDDTKKYNDSWVNINEE